MVYNIIIARNPYNTFGRSIVTIVTGTVYRLQVAVSLLSF